MPDFQFDMQLVVDPRDENNVVREAPISIYAAEDTSGSVLLPLMSPSGSPLPNPLPSNTYGYLPPHVTTTGKTRWQSGDYEGFFFSWQGLLDNANAARDAAELAAIEAGMARADATAAKVAAEIAAAKVEAGGITAINGGTP